MTTQVDLLLRSQFDRQTVRVFTKATEIMEAALLSSGIEASKFNLVPKTKARWKSGKNGSLRLQASQGREIRVRIKCTGNDECWDYSLVPANGSTDLDHVLQHLESKLGQLTDDDGEDECTLGEIPQPTAERNGKHEPMAIVPPASIPVPEPVAPPNGVSPLALLDKLRDAILRRDSRLSDIEKVRREIATLDADIDRMSATKEKLLMRILELEEENAHDKDAKAADQISQLLGQFS